MVLEWQCLRYLKKNFVKLDFSYVVIQHNRLFLENDHKVGYFSHNSELVRENQRELNQIMFKYGVFKMTNVWLKYFSVLTLLYEP